MARKRVAVKRVLPPDVKYGSELVTKFINCVMQRGKKTIAQKIVYEAFAIIEADPDLALPEHQALREALSGDGDALGAWGL